MSLFSQTPNEGDVQHRALDLRLMSVLESRLVKRRGRLAGKYLRGGASQRKHSVRFSMNLAD